MYIYIYIHIYREREVCMYICICIYIYIYILSPASRRGRDKRGFHRRATYPPDELSRGNVVKQVWQHMSKCGTHNTHVAKHVATRAHLTQTMTT